MALQVRLMSTDVTRRQLHSSTPVQGVLSVMGMFQQLWRRQWYAVAFSHMILRHGVHRPRRTNTVRAGLC